MTHAPTHTLPLPAATAPALASDTVRLAAHSCARCGAQTLGDPLSSRTTHKASTPFSTWTWLVMLLIGPLPALLIHRMTRHVRDVEATLCARCTGMYARRHKVYMSQLFFLGVACVPVFSFGMEAGFLLFFALLLSLPFTAYWSKFRVKLRPVDRSGQLLLFGAHPRALANSPPSHTTASLPQLPHTPHPSYALPPREGPSGADGCL